MTQEEKAIVDVLERYGQAANASDLEAVMALYAEDSALLAQESPTAVGREAVRAAYGGIFAAVKLDITFKVAEVRVLVPEWAFLRSTSSGTITIKANGVTIPESNQELFVFQKAAANWKIARYAFSVTSPASAS